MTNQEVVRPPDAEQIDYTVEAEGGNRRDPYFWMRLTDEQKEASHKDDQTRKVYDYLNAENAYCKEILKPTVNLQKKLYNEITGRIKQEDESVPFFMNGYWYYTSFNKGSEYPVFCRKKTSLETTEEVLLDVNEMAKGYDYYDVKSFSVSEDNKILAYSLDTVSRRIYTIYFKDLTTGKLIGLPITNVEPDMTWANDNKTPFLFQER